MHKVVITDFIADDLAPEREALSGLATVEAFDAFHEDQFVGRIEDAAAIMMYHNIRLTRPTIERLEQCRLIVRCGVGFDNVDHAFARERGIAVANVPDYGTEEVADSAIGMMLALTRGIHQFNTRLHDRPDPWMYHVFSPLHRLRGRTFAIVGLGRIGIATALRAKALGMDVAFFDPYRQDGFDKALGIRRVESLEELFHQAVTRSVSRQHRPRRRGRYDRDPGGPLLGPARRRGHRRLAAGAAGRRRSATRRLARPRASGLRAADHQSARRFLFRGGPARHAGEGVRRLPPRTPRRTPPQHRELIAAREECENPRVFALS
jgi:hypothetical protein